MSAAVAPQPTSGPKTEERADPQGRLERLCDPGTFRSIRSSVVSQRMDRITSGDGVVAGAGSVAGRPVFCYAEDPSVLGGSLGEAHADSIVRVMRLAAQARAPVVGFVESGGARLQEGHAALGGYGRIFRASVELAGISPQISIVSGVSAGGGAYSPALTDFVLMTERAAMFLTGPKVVREALGEDVSIEELGGPRVHKENGVCHLVAADEAGAIDRCRDLLAHLPPSIGERTPRTLAEPNDADPAATVPGEARRVYDIRDVVGAVADPGSTLELSPRWARNMVTSLARIDGRSVGVIANQPRWLGGVIDAAAAEKAAWFVDTCNRFRLPLVVMVDTPGFMPGTRQEQLGVIRHGASLLRAFAGASVPKLTVIVRKAFGGAVITMNSKDLGADMVFAWPGAEIGIMAAKQAVGIVHRREIEAGDAGLRDSLADQYAGEHLTADAAAASGFVDEVIEPQETRERLGWALHTMEAS